MPSPFPGMDPYLENPELWSGVHSRLIVAIADAVAPLVRPKYYVDVEKRVYLSGAEDAVLVGIPDVAVLSKQPPATQLPSVTLPTVDEPVKVILPMPQEIREGYLEIRETKTGQVVTVSPLYHPLILKMQLGLRGYIGSIVAYT